MSINPLLYNRQLHQKEVKFLEENLPKFKEYIENNPNYNTAQKDYILDHAGEFLTQGALYLVDEQTKNQVDNFTASTPFPKEQLFSDIANFLTTNSQGLTFTDVYDESMRNQPYFTARDDQFKDPTWNPSVSQGLPDNSYWFIPSAKVGEVVGNATKEVGSIAFTKGSQIYDDVTFKVTEKIGNISPTLINPRYVIGGAMGVDVIGGAYLPDPPSNPLQSLGFSIKRFIIDRDFSSPFKNPKDNNE